MRWSDDAPERARYGGFVDLGHPSLKVYADMGPADRELRLAGYEVYRFGANELVGEGAESRIADFFEKLFRLHRVRPCAANKVGAQAPFRRNDHTPSSTRPPSSPCEG